MELHDWIIGITALSALIAGIMAYVKRAKKVVEWREDVKLSTASKIREIENRQNVIMKSLDVHTKTLEKYELKAKKK